MAQKDQLITIGISEITLQELNNIGADVGAPLKLGQTLEDSFNWTTEEGTTIDIRVEETDKPIYSKPTEGTSSIEWISPNVDPEVLAKVTGGKWTELTGYDAPLKTVIKDYRVTVKTEDGYDVVFNRVPLKAAHSGNLGRNNALELTAMGNLLSPVDGKAPYSLKKKG